jgi:transposase
MHKGREFAAWMGPLPKQYSTGGKAKLCGISKRGNGYLRKILIHGARAGIAMQARRCFLSASDRCTHSSESVGIK